MQNKKAARVDFVKAIAGISFTTLAAIGSSTGNPLLAGLAAMPAAGLASHTVLSSHLSKLKTQKDKYLELSPPPWWMHDTRSWQNLCVEIGNHLPQIFQRMQQHMLHTQQVMTRDHVRELFIEALEAEYLTWEHDAMQRRRVGEFVADPFLQKLAEVLHPIIEQIQQECALIDSRRTAQHTEQIVQVLEKIHAGMGQIDKPRLLSDAEVLILHRQYAEALRNRWKMLDFKGIMHIDMNRPISVPLADVFVSPDLLSGAPEYETLERDPEGHLSGNRSSSLISKQPPPQREPLDTVLTKQRRVVLLGDPGSGKSTLLRYLLLQLMQENDLPAATLLQNSEDKTITPLYMPLTAFAEVLQSNPPGTRAIEDFVPLYLHDNYLGAYESLILEQLRRGNLLLLFDGLDEIPEASLRIKVVRHLEMFTQAYAENRFIVTSRIIGYREAPLSSDYQVYTIADFNEEQIKTFAQRWCPAYEYWVRGTREGKYLEDATTKEAKTLFYATQSKPAVKRLAVNPLLLTILALIQRQGIDLPSHRIELFELCAMTLIDTWVKAKGQSVYFSKNELIKILRPLAFWMHEHPAVGAIPEGELHEQVVKQLTARSIDEHEAAKLAEQFLQTVRGKTGILVERGKGRYGFLHLTFEEYFAAMELEKHRDRNTFIRTHLHNPRWREVILLNVNAIGILRSNEEEVTELVYDVIAKAGSPFEEILHRDLLFAGQCLADDIGVNIAREVELIQRIIYLYLTTPYRGLRESCATLLNTWSGTKAAAKALDLVLPILQQLVVTPDQYQSFSPRSLFEKRLDEWTKRLTDEYSETVRKRLSFHLTIVLHCLGALDGIDWKGNIQSLLTEDFARDRMSQLRDHAAHEQRPIAEALYIALSEPDYDVRSRVVGSLGQVGYAHPKVIDALLTELDDAYFIVEKMAAGAFKRLGIRQQRIINDLLTSLTRSTFTAESTLNALWDQSEEDTSIINASLVALVDVDSRSTRQAAANVFKRLSKIEHQFINTILRVVVNPTNDAIEKFAELLGGLSDNPTAISETLLSSFSSDVNAKEVAIRALGYIGMNQPEVTTVLLTSLTDSNPWIKAAAATSLGQRSDRQDDVIDTLLSILSDPEWLVRREGIKALAQLRTDDPRILDALLSATTDADSDVREAAALSLAQLELINKQVIDALLSTLADSRSNVSIAGTEALVRIGAKRPEIVSHLRTALADDSSSILLQNEMGMYKKEIFENYVGRIFRLLKEIESNHPQIIEILFATIFNPDSRSSIRGEAARALGQLGKKDPLVIDTLLSALTHSEAFVRKAIIQALEVLDQDQYDLVDRLFEALLDPVADVRAQAARALGKHGKEHPLVINALFRSLSDSDSGYVRQLAVSGLRQLGDGQPSVIDALLQVLYGSSWTASIEAAVALGKLGKGKTDLIAALLSALSDSNIPKRVAAIEALGVVNDGQLYVIDALLPLLRDPSWIVRESAARTMRSLESKPPYVIDALLTALADPYPGVRIGAVQALRPINDVDQRVFETLIEKLNEVNWVVRWNVASTLATARTELDTIGAYIEEQLLRHEKIIYRDLGDIGYFFASLLEVADKMQNNSFSSR